MKRKLKVEELEARIAPSVGLFSFLSSLAAADEEVGAVFNQLVDQDGNVDVPGATSAFNSLDTGNSIASVRDTFTLTDDLVIPDSTAGLIRDMLANR
ncbi:MAG: hypothetical protein Q9Q40_15080 [Acidobacteriota bacterium]|nr:hypothetical protein [Acidobacteriota bacterium]MDQ7086484.1 hypothetical protein [Acidobacteriota bacterium]